MNVLGREVFDCSRKRGERYMNVLGREERGIWMFYEEREVFECSRKRGERYLNVLGRVNFCQGKIYPYTDKYHKGPIYLQDLRAEISSELSGDFRDLVLALLENPATYDAQHLRNALKVTLRKHTRAHSELTRKNITFTHTLTVL